MEVNTKKCSRCKAVKSLNNFTKDKYASCGYVSQCNICRKKKRDERKVERAIKRKKYYEDNKEYFKQQGNEYYIKNKEKKSQKQKEDRIKNGKEKRRYAREYYHKNRERLRNNSKIWIENNKEKHKQYGIKTRKKYAKEISQKNKLKYRTDLNFKLSQFLRNSINHSLKGGKNWETWSSFVDFTFNELKSHLESQFTEGMSWEKYLNGDIHIDHILPTKLFSFEKKEDIQFKICWALNNLRPIWNKDNWSKNDFLPNGKRACSLNPEEKLEFLRSLGHNL